MEWARGCATRARDSKEAKCREKQWWSHRNLTYDRAHVKRADSDSNLLDLLAEFFWRQLLETIATLKMWRLSALGKLRQWFWPTHFFLSSLKPSFARIGLDNFIKVGRRTPTIGHFSIISLWSDFSFNSWHLATVLSNCQYDSWSAYIVASSRHCCKSAAPFCHAGSSARYFAAISISTVSREKLPSARIV